MHQHASATTCRSAGQVPEIAQFYGREWRTQAQWNRGTTLVCRRHGDVLAGISGTTAQGVRRMLFFRFDDLTSSLTSRQHPRQAAALAANLLG
jgi:hypothetical protein